MVEAVCYVDVALWCVPVTLELRQGEYGAAEWCRKASIDFRTLLDHLGHYKVVR